MRYVDCHVIGRSEVKDYGLGSRGDLVYQFTCALVRGMAEYPRARGFNDHVDIARAEADGVLGC
jgi:hypothetical protein